jgi:hypothetical protein
MVIGYPLPFCRDIGGSVHGAAALALERSLFADALHRLFVHRALLVLRDLAKLAYENLSVIRDATFGRGAQRLWVPRKGGSCP